MIAAEARTAPRRFDKTSKISALLVVVKISCIISTKIPKTNENTTANSRGLTLLEQINFFFKYKNQRNVNTK